MNEASSTANTRPEGRAAALLARYDRAGYVRAEPALLQPAEPFLDLSGEDIRRRMYLTTDAAGQELCLRPDLTIPVSGDYLASPAAGKPAGVCYIGTGFCYLPRAPGAARPPRLPGSRQARGFLPPRPGVPLSAQRAGRVRAGRHRVVRPARH